MNTATSHNPDTLAAAHALINEALKTATNEEARALLDQRRELNIISRDIHAAKRQAEIDAAEITLTRGELKALYTIDGGEPISGAELDELNEGDQDTRAAIRAAYHGESYEGQGASVELYTEPAPLFIGTTPAGVEWICYPRTHQNESLESFTARAQIMAERLAELKANAERKAVERKAAERKAAQMITPRNLAELKAELTAAHGDEAARRGLVAGIHADRRGVELAFKVAAGEINITHDTLTRYQTRYTTARPTPEELAALAQLRPYTTARTLSPALIARVANHPATYTAARPLSYEIELSTQSERTGLTKKDTARAELLATLKGL